MTEPLLPAIAKDIAIWFPELEGRSLAVSEAEITKENLPTLPLVMVALLREDVDHSWVSASGKIEIMDDFVVEFLLKPVRYTRTDGSETPFWSFYDYEALRDRLLSRVVRWAGPKKQRLQYISLAVESDQFSVSVAFRFRSHFRWCAEDDPLEEQDLIGGDGQRTKLEGKLCVPKSTYCGPAFDPPKDCEPCS